jgi:hypothetical protein
MEDMAGAHFLNKGCASSLINDQGLMFELLSKNSADKELPSKQLRWNIVFQNNS